MVPAAEKCFSCRIMYSPIDKTLFCTKKTFSLQINAIFEAQTARDRSRKVQEALKGSRTKSTSILSQHTGRLPRVKSHFALLAIHKRLVPKLRPDKSDENVLREVPAPNGLPRKAAKNVLQASRLMSPKHSFQHLGPALSEALLLRHVFLIWALALLRGEKNMPPPPPPPIFGQKAFFRGRGRGGWGVYFEAPHGRNFIHPPSPFITPRPPPLEGYFVGWWVGEDV